MWKWLFVMKVQGQILVNANYYGETIIINAYWSQSEGDWRRQRSLLEGSMSQGQMLLWWFPLEVMLSHTLLQVVRIQCLLENRKKSSKYIRLTKNVAPPTKCVLFPLIIVMIYYGVNYLLVKYTKWYLFAIYNG